MSNEQARSKDTMILFRSTTRGKNSKGGDRLTLYLNTDQVQAVINELTATLDNPKGAKLDIHTSKKETQDGSRTFDSTIAFVKAVQEMGASTGPANTKFVPKKTSPSYDEAKVAKVKRELA